MAVPKKCRIGDRVMGAAPSIDGAKASLLEFIVVRPIDPSSIFLLAIPALIDDFRRRIVAVLPRLLAYRWSFLSVATLAANSLPLLFCTSAAESWAGTPSILWYKPWQAWSCILYNMSRAEWYGLLLRRKPGGKLEFRGSRRRRDRVLVLTMESAWMSGMAPRLELTVGFRTFGCSRSDRVSLR